MLVKHWIFFKQLKSCTNSLRFENTRINYKKKRANKALGLPTKLAPYRSDTVYPAMIATTLSQYEYVLICDKSNIRVSGSPHWTFLLYCVAFFDSPRHYPAELLKAAITG
ncbi:hypothetical protein PHYBLDRAFT_170877 [Phycomyces blakesleeanus NRRL 1555(-)]|uniref:Uncharacterized protein n=1 Tax=Phycomyces blakesleeanus (strain ATCC 8743b / DSM 1359 / FGSC 10004 / NBRC 33097 / NRRL 1555) TaxID=763407 RepID=A0A163DEY7_PHYB8|nr:hypothetical protein PHYBLDRAFT_170877 [Phycomyces blakesleeanus NRRL 1555(-)]OAD70790.1 hypothetical protein PHYBLDRAFT_170877 [Phycomyces blakesleeanus NRRL 1555(-)]|eukprot:XP_018288830.1 hypothetical protein PHYBLDRAFT_170877 [Phycomyces blakesleeanus NRRL 1555(-)]